MATFEPLRRRIFAVRVLGEGKGEPGVIKPLLEVVMAKNKLGLRNDVLTGIGYVGW